MVPFIGTIKNMQICVQKVDERLAEAGGGENRELLLNDYRVSAWSGEKVFGNK